VSDDLPATPSSGPGDGSSAGEPTKRPRSIGLVLGAGGVAGYAYEVGALAALGDHGGFDARDADLIVGTSAGAGLASALRAGLSATDHYAHLLGRPVEADARDLLHRGAEGPWDSGGDHGGKARPTSALLAARGLAHWPPRPGLTIAGALRRGRRNPAPLRNRHAALHPTWPARPLWLCAVRVRDGRRTVFGRDDHRPLGVGDAVAASSAVPGFFAPVEIDGDDYLDGAVWSPTNADLVAGLGFDTVVVIAPLSGPFGPGDLPRRLWDARRSWAGPVRLATRAYHRSVLEAEIRRIHRLGTPVVTIEPTEDDLPVLEPSSTGGGRPDVAEQAYASVTARLRSEPHLVPLLRDAVAR
jgi:NTE family protein